MTPVRAAGLLAMLAPAACAREPAEAVCPELAAGDLVVTEVRYTDELEDPLGSWIELHNASGRAIDLLGVKLRIRDAQDGEDGGLPLLVRRSLAAAPGGYTVLGLFDDVDPPPHVDYGFLVDYAAADRTWVGGRGAIHVDSCGAEIDRAPYVPRSEPGTYSLGGAPDARRNDDELLWCTDRTQVGTTFPGTPRTQNITCP